MILIILLSKDQRWHWEYPDKGASFPNRGARQKYFCYKQAKSGFSLKHNFLHFVGNFLL